MTKLSGQKQELLTFPETREILPFPYRIFWNIMLKDEVKSVNFSQYNTENILDSAKAGAMEKRDETERDASGKTYNCRRAHPSIAELEEKHATI